MKASNEVKSNIIDQYLQASCFSTISQSDLKEMLDYEEKADPAEQKLIKRVKDQVRRGRIVLSGHDAKKIPTSLM